MLAADAAASREECNIHTCKIVTGKILHNHLAPAEVDGLAGASRAGQRHEFTDRELALDEDADQGIANGAGGTDHGHLESVFLAHFGNLGRSGLKRGKHRSDPAAGLPDPIIIEQDACAGM